MMQVPEPASRVARDFESMLPAHACGLYIEHNPHRDYYESVADYAPDAEDWISPEERAAAVAADEMWRVQWYPRTPVGCSIACAYSLASLLAFLATAERD